MSVRKQLILIVSAFSLGRAQVVSSGEKKGGSTPVVVELFHSEGCSSCPRIS